jgi:hypothetical protein
MDYYKADVELREMGMMAGDAAAIQRAIKEIDPAGGYDPGYLVRVITRIHNQAIERAASCVDAYQQELEEVGAPFVAVKNAETRVRRLRR